MACFMCKFLNIYGVYFTEAKAVLKGELTGIFLLFSLVRKSGQLRIIRHCCNVECVQLDHKSSLGMGL